MRLSLFLSASLAASALGARAISQTTVQAGDFVAPTGFDTGLYLDAFYPYWMDVGDVDADGQDDVVVTNSWNGPKVGVLLGGPDGVFQPPVQLGLAGGSFEVVLADVDGDARPDIVASEYGTSGEGSGVAVFRNQGGGAFGPRNFFATGSGSFVGPVGIAAADYDADGRLDLAVANFGRIGLGSTVAVLLNTGAGFAAPLAFPVGSRPYRLAAGDLDGDGDQDIVVARDGQKISVLRNNGSGFDPFVEYSVFSSVNTDVYSNVALADEDGDGDLDVFYGSTTTSKQGVFVVALFRNAGDGTFAAPVGIPTDPNLGSAVDLEIADVTGDGRLDILTTHLDSGGWSMIAADGAGGYLPAVEIPGGRDPVAVRTTDADADGDLDAVVLTRDTLMVSVHLNPGSGFEPPAGSSLPTLSHDLDAADVDGDGDLDVAVSYGYAGGGGIGVAIQQGPGAFAPSVDYPGEAAMAVKLRDLDGDGDQDLLWADHPTAFTNGYDFVVRLNAGDGSFGPARIWTVGTCGNGDVDTFDMDNDGDLDVFLTDYLGCAGGVVSTYVWISRNRGEAQFDPPYAYVTPLNPMLVRGADLNGDGNQDLLFTDFTGVGVGLGDGTGSFGPPTVHPTAGAPQGLTVGDWNGDGWLDVATGNEGGTSETVSVLLGTGDGGFLPAVDYDAAHDSIAVGIGDLVSGDVDRDGDLDLLAANQANGDVSVFRNLGDGSFAAHVRYMASFGATDLFFADFTGNGIGDLAVVGSLPPFNLAKELVILRGTAGEDPTGPRRHQRRRSGPAPVSR